MEKHIIQREERSWNLIIINFLREIQKVLRTTSYPPPKKRQSKILEKLKYESRNYKKNLVGEFEEKHEKFPRKRKKYTRREKREDQS